MIRLVRRLFLPVFALFAILWQIVAAQSIAAPSSEQSAPTNPVLKARTKLVIVDVVAAENINRTRFPCQLNAQAQTEPASCLASDSTGCIYGTVADERDKPVEGLKIELLPANKTGDDRWRSMRFEFTDRSGNYSFNQLDPDQYLIAVHYYDAPDEHYPFATVFYPSGASEDHAEQVMIKARLETKMTELRLRRLPLATIKVDVNWPDGTRPKWSNLLFHNLSYPSQGVIGDTAPGVEDGSGEFTLPEGFEYYARAKVDCDAGSKIETRESRPVQEIKFGNGNTPRRLIFTIPGPPCKLWSPK